MQLEHNTKPMRTMSANFSVNLDQTVNEKYSKIWWVKCKSKKGIKRNRWVKVHRISVMHLLASKMAKDIADEIDKDIMNALMGLSTPTS